MSASTLTALRTPQVSKEEELAEEEPDTAAKIA